MCVFSTSVALTLNLPGRALTQSYFLVPSYGAPGARIYFYEVTVNSRYIEAGYNEVSAYIEMGLSPQSTKCIHFHTFITNLEVLMQLSLWL